MSNVTEIKPGTHAHYCAFCASQGVETIWAHGNENAGNLDQHRCPRCGHVEWVQMNVPSGKLPQMTATKPQVIAVVTLTDAVVSCILYAFAAVGLSYLVLFLYQKFLGKKDAAK